MATRRKIIFRTHLLSIVRCISWENLKKSNFIQQSDYVNTCHIHINYCFFTNATYNIPRLPNQEVVYLVSSNYEGSRVNLTAEQKNVSYNIYLVGKFTNPGELFVDCFTGTFYVSKACLLLLKHLRVVVYDIYEACLEFSKEIIFHV